MNETKQELRIFNKQSGRIRQKNSPDFSPGPSQNDPVLYFTNHHFTLSFRQTEKKDRQTDRYP